MIAFCRSGLGRWFTAAGALTAIAAFAGCGGGGGAGTGNSLPGLVLVNFLQAGQDNVPLNRVLQFTFSSPIDPASVGPASIQIRIGPNFGQAVFGKYIVEGEVIRFEPKLPGLCNLTDGGFQPDLDYRVTIIGSPEEFALRDLTQKPLQGTVSSSFHTRKDTDPELFEDQIPAVSPTVVSTTPVDGANPLSVPASVAATVAVHQGNTVTIHFSENLNPCSVTESTVLFFQYATGAVVGPAGVPMGFSPAADQTPSDPKTWGSGNLTTPARRVRSSFSLQQDFLSTTLVMTPVFGEFPDNALLVVEVTNAVKDLGNNPLTPYSFGFVTENRVLQTLTKTFEFNGDVPINTGQSTAEVNTARSLSKVQGFLLFAGDSDNGLTANINRPAGPDNSKGPLGCVTAGAPTPQANDGTPDDFDPIADFNLDTGATRNTCLNTTDGSTAVVWEFRTFHIKNGVTVRVIGVNPAIILVTGDIVIESGGRLLTRADGGNGAPNGAGGNGASNNTTTNPAGGIGMAGAGTGGLSVIGSTAVFNGNGAPGFGSPDYLLSPGLGGDATPVRVGAGRGGGSMAMNNYNPANRCGVGGGGAGHAQAAGFANQGTANGTGTNGFQIDFPSDSDGNGGRGGGTYGALSGKMPTPEAGSGGGAAGLSRGSPFQAGSFYAATGGAGGAGGGFMDLTSSKNISIFGTLDASGSRGGAGGGGFYNASGGGGGGSGGGIRLLTPGMINFTSTTIVTVAGGAAGSGGVRTYIGYGNPPACPGGPGGNGRLVLETGDSLISGFVGANLVLPTEGASGFYRGLFDATRFQGGGLRPVALTTTIDMGPFSPTFLTAIQNYAGQQDFIAGIPAVASRGINKTGIFIEVQGFFANADGSVNVGSATGWKSVGYFVDSGSELFPTWFANSKPPVGDIAAALLPSGNTGDGFNLVNGCEFCQFRFSFYLPSTMGPFDAGPYIDQWKVNLQYNQ